MGQEQQIIGKTSLELAPRRPDATRGGFIGAVAEAARARRASEQTEALNLPSPSMLDAMRQRIEGPKSR